jgi:5-methylcytosine-specific restriction endonuclease McrBC regulatory subunit McrC
MKMQSTNPFSLIDNRLKSIESTLAILAAKEQLQAKKKLVRVAQSQVQKIATKKKVKQRLSILKSQVKSKIDRKSSINKLLDFIALILRFCLLLH